MALCWGRPGFSEKGTCQEICLQTKVHAVEEVFRILLELPVSLLEVSHDPETGHIPGLLF
jgi:hypothetical protein